MPETRSEPAAEPGSDGDEPGDVEHVIGPEMRGLTEQTLVGFSAAERAELIGALRRIQANRSKGSG